VNKFTELMKLMEEEEPEPADVIVWLQGDKLDRGEKVMQLCIEDGYASNIILSGTNVNPHYEDYVSLGTMAHWLIDTAPDLRDIGFPSSMFIDHSATNTYEHAEGVLRIAREMGWKRLLLVTSLYHQPRAFLAFLPYLQPNEVIINQPWKGVSFREKEANYKYPFRAGNGYLTEQEWEKVDRGVEVKLLASIEEGIAYINNRMKKACK